MDSSSYALSNPYPEEKSDDSKPNSKMCLVIGYNILSIVYYLSGISLSSLIGYVLFFSFIAYIANAKFALIKCDCCQFDLSNEKTIKLVYAKVYHWVNSFFDLIRYLTTVQAAFYKSIIVLALLIEVSEHFSTWFILNIASSGCALCCSDSEYLKEQKTFLSNLAEYTVNVFADSIPKYEEDADRDY